MEIKPVTREEWIAALESGKYEQTKGQLLSVAGGYCCLGVLCSLAGIEDDRLRRQAISNIIDFFPDGLYIAASVNMDINDCDRLAIINDDPTTHNFDAVIKELRSNES